MIHVAITRRVRAGHERAFEQALRRFFRAALAESSTLGASLILPAPESGSNEYGVLRSFQDDAAKEAFYRSDTYRRWELEVASLVEGEVNKHELHGLEAFFRSDGLRQPPVWKMAVLTWLAVNPAVWIWSQLGSQPLASAPPWIGLIVTNVFVVATLSWAFMPALVRVFSWWLR
jgi:antibiotic biosynthesis monooxygenase (ABM) superfamily enzyme